jgi:mannose-1-phosphate guanylyltransferase
MSYIDTAMVLAAGFGQRARPLSFVRPKPLFPVLNIPLIDRILGRLKTVGVKKVVVNTHHLADTVTVHLHNFDTDLNIHTLMEPEILGTGGGIKNAEAFLSEKPFYVVNSDVYSDIDFIAAAKTHFACRALATLVMHDYPLFNQVAVANHNQVVGFRNNRPDESGGPARTLAFTGVHVLNPGIFKYIPSGPGDIIDVYQYLIDKGEPPAAHVAKKLVWHDAGTRERYLDLHCELLTGRDDSPILIDESAHVAETARLEGFVCVGPGATVEPGAVVKDTVLWPNSRVDRDARVINSVVADNAVARGDIRDQAVVDNFQIPDGH